MRTLPYGRFFGAKETIIHMTYPGGIHLELSEDRNPNGGALFIGEKGQIRIDRGNFQVSDPEWKSISLEDMPVQLYKSADHIGNFVDCIKSRKKCICDVEIGHRSATVCHLGNIARWVSQQTQAVGDKLIWDPVKERFKDNDLANSMLEPATPQGIRTAGSLSSPSVGHTARLLADNPTLMRLRELEVLEKIASAGHLNVVLGEKGLADKVVNLL